MFATKLKKAELTVQYNEVQKQVAEAQKQISDLQKQVADLTIELQCRGDEMVAYVVSNEEKDAVINQKNTLIEYHQRELERSQNRIRTLETRLARQNNNGQTNQDIMNLTEFMKTALCTHKFNCMICFEENLAFDKVAFNYCGHSFCKKCFEQCKSCPLCRKEIAEFVDGRVVTKVL
jgi:uncharacterized coiled-coil protein SlyX